MACFRPQTVFAQTETPYDLIAEINALRASLGLEPYEIDPWIMAYAQDHADYIAETMRSSHDQRDGSGPDDAGLHENVAGGDVGYITPYVAVYEIWADWGHRHILVDYPSGTIGAGIAIAADGQIHYVVNIREEDGAFTWITPTGGIPGGNSGMSTPEGEFTPPPFKPFVTSTPSADGALIHLVQEGQALWSIAISYGVTVDDIRRLNGLAADATDIYVGQKLLIREAGAPIPTSVVTASAVAVASQTPVVPTFTPRPEPTHTMAPATTPSPTPEDGLFASNGRSLLPVVLVLAAGLVGLLIVQFRKGK
jgi:LysM repeat protein